VIGGAAEHTGLVDVDAHVVVARQTSAIHLIERSDCDRNRLNGADRFSARISRIDVHELYA
jgi:hypothetical protein